MGKRSTFPRRKNDAYPTPYSAVLPLVPYLKNNHAFIEPCAGAGDLVKWLRPLNLVCCGAHDLPIDARTHYYVENYPGAGADVFITNPPWTREILHPIINNLRLQRPTWLLFDAGWMFTKQAKEYLKFCEKIVTVGRVKWIPDSPYTGKDDCCWYLFKKDLQRTEFVGKA